MPPTTHRQGLSRAEVLAIVAVIAVGLILALPALRYVARYQTKPAVRVSCANNLKQWGLIFWMYTSENNGLFPPRADYLDGAGWFPDPSVIWPDYWTDPSTALCPNDDHAVTANAKNWLPTKSAKKLLDVIAGSLPAEPADADKECATYLRAMPWSYLYTGYVVEDWGDIRALGVTAEATYLAMPEADRTRIDLTGTACDLPIPTVRRLPGFFDTTPEGLSMPRLSEGIARSFITDTTVPNALETRWREFPSCGMSRRPKTVSFGSIMTPLSCTYSTWTGTPRTGS